jgi:hypothetical protein
MQSRPARRAAIVLAFAACALAAQTARKITTPKEALGFNIGDDYQVASYTQLEAYWKTLAAESDRMKLESIGSTAEGRPQYMAVITSPENMKRLDRYKEIARKLALAEGLTDEQAHALASEGKAVVWIDGGLHATETVGSQQLMEMIYQMVSRTDPETMRFLNDVILLCVAANPDGQEMVANWYMREKEPTLRSMANLPSLYQKYIGHDDNRDFYRSAMPETTNMNHALFHEWFPQLMYNHHQTGPAGTVIFMPPFRDPFNYNFDPLVPLGIEMVATAMHSRLVAEGKGGSIMRSGANYSTWWNGGLRTVTYFHNVIGILTEIIGSPTPMKVELVPDKQLPRGDLPMPVAPQTWHYRQSIDYEITNNRALLDIASRYRETWLYNIYQMGRNSIQKGSRDNWTITPKRIAALREAARKVNPGASDDGVVPAELYGSVLHDMKARDPRGYIIPSDQPDFPTAVEFVNTLIKNGISILKATAPFQVAGKAYPAGSLVVKTAQAFRPHIMDMFEPQDHPNDIPYPGAPPNRPYDIAGWTLAYQMGVKFDRVLDGFDGPFEKVAGLLPPPPAQVDGPQSPAGYLVSHRLNNSFTLVNRLLKANCGVYWLKTPAGKDPGPGALWIPASEAARPIVERAASELGVPAQALANAPPGEALKLKPIRIGLVDIYGGAIPSGWTRWIFEQFEFPFEVVFPQALDAGNLRNKFDVILFPEGTLRPPSPRDREISPQSIPAQYRNRLGRATAEKTAPELRKFVKAGGTVIAVGRSSTLAGKFFGLPIRNWLAEETASGRERELPPEKFFIPGSLLKMNVDNSNPLGYGLPAMLDVFYDNSPVFRLDPPAALKGASPVAWFSGTDLLESGWAWGQQYLDGGTAVVQASVGKGRVVLFGPEVTFRSQPHAAFKLLFNALYYGSAEMERSVN